MVSLLLQLWSHIYRQRFHANIDTNNFTEGFNSSLRKYLLLRHDKSVYSLVKILVSLVFPEQEREYIELNIRQSEQYRKRTPETMPPYLQNRPQEVRAACMQSIEKAKQIEASCLQDSNTALGTYTVKTTGGCYETNITAGTCSCIYYQKQKMPCKHMFAVFRHTSLGWNDLPKELTEAPYMRLDLDTCNEPCAQDSVSQEYIGVDEEVTDEGNGEIPPKVTPGRMVAKLQRSIRDELAKCASMAYMVNDAPLLAEVHAQIQAIHLRLLQTARCNPQDSQLPVISLLVKANLSDYRRRSKLTARANMVLRKYRKRKASNDVPLQSKRMRLGDDPLLGASRRSVGRPKLKGKRRKTQSGEDTLITLIDHCRH